MELVTDVVNNQLFLYFPVALVLVGAVLVFTFGFKSAEQPPFDKLASTLSADKKTASKKRKTKDKKTTVNGSAVPVSEVKATKEKQSPNKEVRTSPKQIKSKDLKKVEVPKVAKPQTLSDLSSKKNVKTKANEKSVDYDDGNWETVPIKSDKKIKKVESPVKKAKKPKKADGDSLIIKDEAHQLTHDNKEDIKKTSEESLQKDEPKEDIPVVEEKKVKKEKKAKVEKEIYQPPVLDNEIDKPVIEKQEHENLKPRDIEESPVEIESTPKGGVAFDELGDVWSDPKAVKKSNKKKPRRDN